MESLVAARLQDAILNVNIITKFLIFRQAWVGLINTKGSFDVASGHKGIDIDKLARECSANRFPRPEPVLWIP